MPSEVTKCRGAECDRRETCWRYLAPSSSPAFQSWAGFDLDRKYALGGSCPHYIETVSASQRRRHQLTTLVRVDEEDAC